MSTALEPQEHRGRDVAFLMLVAALPVVGFQFGLGNQVEQFPLVERLADPSFLAGDFYVDSGSGFGPRTYYVWLLFVLTRVAPLPVVIFGLSLLTNFALAAVSFDAVRRHIGGDRVAGAIAAILAVANGSFALGYAGFLRFDSYQPASLAIPLALVGASSLFAGRRWLGALAFALASLMHPLVGVETAGLAFAAAGAAELLRRDAERGLPARLLGYVGPGLAFGAAVVAAWALPAMGSGGERLPDQEFFETLAVFRAPHHYLARHMPPGHHVTALLFGLCTAYLGARLLRERGAALPPLALLCLAALVPLACAASVVGVDVLHSRAATTAQLFRTLMLLKWVGFLLFARVASGWLQSGRPLPVVAALVPVIATGEAQPPALVASVASVELAGLLGLSRGLRTLGAVGLAAVGAALGWLVGHGEEMVRAGAGVWGLWWVYRSRASRALAWGLAASVLAALIGFGLYNRSARVVDVQALLPTYGYDDLREPDVDVARWARAHTPEGSLFIVPPRFERFRLLAERPVAVDFTSIPFGDAALREWRNRMLALYGPVQGGGFAALAQMDSNYREVSPEALRRDAARLDATFAVLHADTPWPDEPLYDDGHYKAVRVAP